MEHKVLNIQWSNTPGWARHLQLELDLASRTGWVPILYSETGGGATVILARPKKP
jgi:hypothetical protein